VLRASGAFSIIGPVTVRRSAVFATLATAALVLAGISGGATRQARGPLHADTAFVAAGPQSTADCLKNPDIGFRCYSPAQIATAYGLDKLYAAGIDGSGTTIAIVIPFGSPTIASDITSFDQTFGTSTASTLGLTPYPPIATDPQLTITQLGQVPPYDPNDGDAVMWAEETTLDVEWAHVVAPKAKILLVETAVDETEGVQGLPEIEAAEKYVVDNGLADIIVQTFGATEQTFPSPDTIMGLRDGLVDAAKHDVTVVNANGDTGSTNFDLNGDLYTMPVVGWPSADPLVTSIGGTSLSLDAAGNRTSPDVVWNDSGQFGFPLASGGGPSSVFSRPGYQDGVTNVVGNARGTPDISMSAALDGGVWVQFSFECAHSCGPFDIAAGTSVATPLFGGVVALADQVGGKPLGQINDALYSIPYGGGLVDVTQGNNDAGPFTIDGKTYDVPGFDAGPGYDLASGLGTVDPTRFVPALAAAACQGKGCGGTAECAGPQTFAAYPGNVHVRKGVTCALTSSAVDGNVNVDPGANLVLNGVDVGGNVVVGPRATCTATGDNIVSGRVNGQCAGL
jgi:subtilase family serine protease